MQARQQPMTHERWIDHGPRFLLPVPGPVAIFGAMGGCSRAREGEGIGGPFGRGNTTAPPALNPTIYTVTKVNIKMSVTSPLTVLRRLDQAASIRNSKVVMYFGTIDPLDS